MGSDLRRRSRRPLPACSIGLVQWMTATRNDVEWLRARSRALVGFVSALGVMVRRRPRPAARDRRILSCTGKLGYEQRRKGV